jgi:signal transduction histidine kinase
MTPEVLAHAFDESFTTKPPTRGRGIGLYVCKSLIEKLGGRIDLASVPGEGTTATVEIPIVPAAPETKE